MVNISKRQIIWFYLHYLINLKIFKLTLEIQSTACKTLRILAGRVKVRLVSIQEESIKSLTRRVKRWEKAKVFIFLF
jgi:hypothetical protein